MKKLFVPLHIAALLEAAGFKESCLASYTDLSYPINDSGNDYGTSLCLSIDCENAFDERKMLWIEKENAHFHWHEGTYTKGDHSRCEFTGELVLAPTWEQAVDWFREKHSLIIEIASDQTSSVKWSYDIVKYNGVMEFENKTSMIHWGLYLDYYECLDAAILEAVKLI